MRPFVRDDVEAAGEKVEDAAVAVAEHQQAIAAIKGVVDVRVDDVRRLPIGFGSRERVHDAVDLDLPIVHAVPAEPLEVIVVDTNP